MIDSALGLDPEDMSEATKAKRILRGFADLAGITFVAKIKVEASDEPAYSDKNKLDHVVVADRRPSGARSWTARSVPARPSTRRAAPPATAAAAAAPASGNAADSSAPTGTAPARARGRAGKPADRRRSRTAQPAAVPPGSNG